MESHAVDTLKKVDAQRSGHMSFWPVNPTVDIWKRGADQKSGRRKKNTVPCF